MSANTRTLIVSGIPVHICKPLPVAMLDCEGSPRWMLVTSHGKPVQLYVSDESLATEEKVAGMLAAEVEP